ncbi:MAG TPA: DUF5302 domain-containing protein [Streptosporangiaceae bacterium]|jgi:hypothetical protein
MADAAPGPESAEDDAEPERPEDEMKRKFRAALDRKRGQLAEHNSRQAGKGGGKVQGAHGPAQSKRSFRRKSGG